jgi:hypothetical protein
VQSQISYLENELIFNESYETLGTRTRFMAIISANLDAVSLQINGFLGALSCR